MRISKLLAIVLEPVIVADDGMIYRSQKAGIVSLQESEPRCHQVLVYYWPIESIFKNVNCCEYLLTKVMLEEDMIAMSTIIKQACKSILLTRQYNHFIATTVMSLSAVLPFKRLVYLSHMFAISKPIKLV